MGSPQQWLLRIPRGAYTTVWVQGGRRLIDWPTHLERLVRSLQGLHAAIEGFYDAYYAWLEVRRALHAVETTGAGRAALPPCTALLPLGSLADHVSLHPALYIHPALAVS